MLQRLKRSLVNETCRFYRSAFLKQTVFIGVTGSCGKTTTKELIAAVLSTHFRVKKTPENCNEPWHIPRIILRAKPRHQFCVLEVGASGPGSLDIPLNLVKPHVGVLTNVGLDHLSRFGDIDGVANEKSKLVAVLPPNGTAVLNADDPHVFEMRKKCAGHVVTFGLSPNAMFRAKDIGGDWPNRLSFTAIYESEFVKVETQLCGAHWMSSVLAAMAVGHVLGVPLPEAAEAIRNVPPFPGRMSPVTTSDGITFIRDDWKAPLLSIPASFDFMRNAMAKRKIIVVGSISDFHGNPASKYTLVARQALEVADVVCFVTDQASMCLRARHNPIDKTLRAFANCDQLMTFLKTVLQPGDLVLLKGSDKADKLDQIVSAWTKQVQPPRSSPVSSMTTSSGGPPEQPAAVSSGIYESILIGLGNPGKQFSATPHNVGRQILDLLAELLGGEWIHEQDAIVAEVRISDHKCLLVKPQSEMNDIGPLMLRMSQRLGFVAADCVVIQDDVDLKLGALRHRTTGSAGGHKGMQSLIIAFQTEKFRRVKIGVGKPDSNQTLAEYLLSPLEAKKRVVVDQTCREAADCVLELTKSSISARKTISTNDPE